MQSTGTNDAAPGNEPDKRAPGHDRSRDMSRLWGRRGYWQIKLRWGVAPVMIVGILAGRALGFEFRIVPVLLIALSSPIYNTFFAWIFSRNEERLRSDPHLDRLFTMSEVVADYAALFLLIFFTGGVSSPLLIFLIFHVIISAIQFRAKTSFQFAALAAGGLWLMFLADLMGWCRFQPVAFQGQPLSLMDPPAQAAGMLFFFTCTLFFTAAMVGRIMGKFRQGVRDLGQANAALRDLNEKLNSLYAMVCAIGAERHLAPILDTITSELARATGVPAVAVKLLSEDGASLRFVAAQGLPEKVVSDSVVRLDQSPLNRRIMEGETLASGPTEGDESLQLQKELSALGIRSAVLAPLRIDDETMGTLGLYAHEEDYFEAADLDFLKLAAEIAAIAIVDAQANEAVEQLMRERAQFMLQVAHNLRAPLSAGLSMIGLLEGGYMGELNPKQSEYLHKIEDRLRALDESIAQLLAIAKSRDYSREIPDVIVDLGLLADKTESTFKDEAIHRGIRFKVEAEEGLPEVDSGAGLLNQIVENLVSNAIKYTPEGGKVDVRFARAVDDTVEITVEDSGIGIPAEEQEKLFQEFFRASNAKQHTTNGTGLGLALVRRVVERHGGHMELDSEEGKGTRVVVTLPIRQPTSTAR